MGRSQVYSLERIYVYGTRWQNAQHQSLISVSVILIPLLLYCFYFLSKWYPTASLWSVSRPQPWGSISRDCSSVILSYNLYSIKQITGSWFHITFVTETGTECPSVWHQLIKLTWPLPGRDDERLLRQCFHVLMSPLKDMGYVNSGIWFPCCLSEFLIPIPWIVLNRSSAKPCTVWVLVRASKRLVLINAAAQCLRFTVPSSLAPFPSLPLSFGSLGLPFSSFPIYWSSPLGTYKTHGAAFWRSRWPDSTLNEQSPWAEASSSIFCKLFQTVSSVQPRLRTAELIWLPYVLQISVMWRW